MKKERKILLVVIIIILITLIGTNISLILEKNIIVKSDKHTIKEMSESTQVTDLNNQINSLNATHTEYMKYIQTCKTQIASALTNEGVTTSNEATLETMAENISKVLQSRTADATAAADDIAEGKTAYVNGQLITGTSKSTQTSEIVQNVIYSIYHNETTNISFSSTGCSSSAHNNNGSWDSDSDSFSFSQTLPLYNTPNGEIAALNIINFSISLSASSAYGSTWGRGSMTYSITTDTGSTLTSGSLSVDHTVNSSGTTTSSNDSASKTVTLNLFSADIDDATSVTITMNGSTSARAATNSNSQGRGSITVNNIYATYIPISV